VPHPSCLFLFPFLLNYLPFLSPKKKRFVVYSVFSLNFSSAGKGPFIASKAKNMNQRWTFLGAWGVVEFIPSFKDLFYANQPSIHPFPCGMWESDRITTCVFFKNTSLILVNLQAVAGGKKHCFRREILLVTTWYENTVSNTCTSISNILAK